MVYEPTMWLKGRSCIQLIVIGCSVGQYKEDWSVKGSVQIKWAGDTTVSASNGTITVTSTDKDTKWKTVVSSTQNWTSNTNTTNPFLNYLDNSNGSYAVVNGIQFRWDGYTTVQSTNGGKEIVISSTPWTWLEVHTQGRNVLGNASTINNGAVSTTNTNTYLNHVEGSSVMNSLKIQWTNWIETSSASSTLTIKGIAATASNLGLIKIGYSANGKNYAVQLDSNNKAYVNVPRTDNNTTYTAGNGLSLASNVFKANLKNETKSSYQATNNIGNVSRSDRLYAVGMDVNGNLAVHVPRTDAGWNNVWEIGNITNMGATLSNAIKPTSTNMSKDLYLPNGNIYHDGHFEIKTLWSTATYRMNNIYVHDYGVSIWDMANRTAWLWVHWPITVGKYSQSELVVTPGHCPLPIQRNTISIYASWAAGNDNFEILWNPRVLIWAKDAWYMYFTSNTDLYNGNIWINKTNPHAKLDINGSIRVGYCSQDKNCDADSAWEIKYYEKNNVWYFVWCRKTSSSSWERVVLSDWTQTKSDNDVSYYCWPTPSVPYNTSIYSTQIVQPSPDCY